MKRITLTQALGIAAFVALVALPFVWPNEPVQAATQAANYKSEWGLGGLIQTSTGSLTALTVPAGAEHADIVVTGSNPVCYTAGVETGTPGIWPAGSERILPNDPLYLKRLKIVTCSGSGAGTVQVYFSRARRFTDPS